MCDFKPGDEVEHIGGVSDPAQIRWFGAPAVVSATGDRGVVTDLWNEDGYARMQVSCRPYFVGGYDVRKWRKVQKRNDRLTIEAFFTVPGGFEEPKRAPAKRRERA